MTAQQQRLSELHDELNAAIQQVEQAQAALDDAEHEVSSILIEITAVRTGVK